MATGDGGRDQQALQTQLLETEGLLAHLPNGMCRKAPREDRFQKN